MRRTICHAEVRILNPGSVADEIRERFATWFTIQKADLVFSSALRDTGDANAHLKWLLGMLEHERKLIRRLQDQGLQMIARVYCNQLPVLIEPESFYLAHKLHVPIE